MGGALSKSHKVEVIAYLFESSHYRFDGKQRQPQANRGYS